MAEVCLTTSKHEALAEYLRAGAQVPFQWGQLDCCLWVADWVMIRRGVDPARDMRGSYGTRAGAYRYLKSQGGLDGVVRQRLAAIGVGETTAPETGDIGIVQIGEGGPFSYDVLAIRASLWWATKSSTGIIVSNMRCRTAWSLG